MDSSRVSEIAFGVFLGLVPVAALAIFLMILWWLRLKAHSVGLDDLWPRAKRAATWFLAFLLWIVFMIALGRDIRNSGEIADKIIALSCLSAVAAAGIATFNMQLKGNRLAAHNAPLSDARALANSLDYSSELTLVAICSMITLYSLGVAARAAYFMFGNGWFFWLYN